MRPLIIACTITTFLVLPATAQDVSNGEDVFKRCRACH
jgi:cytochrome c2